MSERFDVRPLIKGLLEGLRKRRSKESDEVADIPTRSVLFGIPAAIFLTMLAFRVEFANSEQLLAGATLLLGALIAAFTQIVSWRERILTRNRETERIKVRALNEAGAHVLVSLIMSVIVTASVFVLANLTLRCAELYIHVIAWVLSALSAGSFAYISLSLVIVANLLWDAFKREEQDIADENLPQLPPREGP